MQTVLDKTTNQAILEERERLYNLIEGPRVGDYLKLPYGIYTRFTHEWEDSLQAGGSSHSYYLGNGYISYSGGLDSGVKKTDITLTGKAKKGWIWFFDLNISGANRGVDFEMDFRVFEPIECADLSGCPQIKRYEREQFLKTVDTITRINGNGQPYTLPLPEIVILQDEINDIVLKHIEENTALTFKRVSWGYSVQPIKHQQLNALLLTYNFKTKYYNNSSNPNQLHLTFNL